MSSSTAEQRQYLATPIPVARRLPEALLQEIAEGALERDLNRVLPYEQIRQLDAAGFGALRVPAASGGPGLSLVELFAQVIALARADSHIAHIYRGHLAFAESLQFQPAEIREHWYRLILSGQTVGNASTEPSGNVLRQLNTAVTGVGGPTGSLRLTGKKFYCTGTIFSDYTRVSAADPGGGRLFAVVAVNAPGVSVSDDWDGFGQRLTGTGTTVFDQVPISEHGLLRRVAGHHEAVHEAGVFQLHLLAVQAGIAQAAVAEAVSIAQRRTRTFNTATTGGLFRDDPLIQGVFGQLSAKAFTAEAAVTQAASALDNALAAGRAAGTYEPDFAGPLPAEVYQAEIAVEQAQLTVSELVLEVTQQIFQTVGASATARTRGLDRHWRNAQVIASHNPAVFKARAVGDYLLNGSLPEGLNAIGDSPAAAS